jgi:hypothetical protein
MAWCKLRAALPLFYLLDFDVRILWLDFDVRILWQIYFKWLSRGFKFSWQLNTVISVSHPCEGGMDFQRFEIFILSLMRDSCGAARNQLYS